MRRARRISLVRTTAAALLGVGLSLGPGHPVQAQSSYEYLQAFSSVLNHIRINYVDSVAYPELVRAAIEGTLRALDPHSYFVSRSDQARMSALERGELAVTGMTVEDGDSAIVVLSVHWESPAAKAGIQPGDRIVAVDDTTVRGLRSIDVQLRLAGRKGSKVEVLLERGAVLEPDTLRVTIKRRFLEEHLVTRVSLVDTVTGYVRLSQFGDGAADEVSDAIKQLRKQGATRIILDLRGNPGGIVNEAMDLSALFLPKGSVVFTTDGRKRGVDRDYVTRKNGRFRSVPLTVLIDRGSASASEAVAGALQDHDRAVIVGRRSFGKALMQTVFLVDPTGDNVWLTVARIQSPSGRIIQRPYKGVGYSQYRALAGGTLDGAEKDTPFHTDNGRPVYGGGGIAPDVEVTVPTEVPVWWSIAVDSGFVTTVADSVAFTLTDEPGARSRWVMDDGLWEERVWPAFLERVQVRLGVSRELPPAIQRRLVRELAARVAEVRWGTDAALDLRLQSDPDVAAAGNALDLAETLLGPPRPQ
ncbi:MAG: S41 family peptidase [Gemmatimonadales bacterium]